MSFPDSCRFRDRGSTKSVGSFMASSFPMTTATYLTGLPEFLGTEIGHLALRRAFSDAGLPTGAKSAASLFVPESTLMSLMESAARHAGDETLGALFGSNVNLGVYDTWGPYVVEADTLGECLRRFSRVLRILASHSSTDVTAMGPQAHLNYRWAERDATGYRQVCLASAGSLLNTLRLYLGPTFLPDEIHLDIARPPRKTLIEDYLPTHIYFDADEISLRFPKALLKTKRPGPIAVSPITFSQVRKHVQTGPPTDIETAVKELIRIQLTSGGPSFDQTCRALDINGRTLRRMLDRSGQQFRELSNRIRLETAVELLRETSMPVRAVAVTVGYSDPYNFSRAFNARYGIRPTAFRTTLVSGVNC